MSLQSLLSTVQFDQAVNVLRDIGAVLPGVGFGVVKVDLVRVEGSKPLVVDPSTHETRFGVEHILISQSPFIKVTGLFLLSHGPSHLGYGPIVIGVLQGFGDRFTFLFHGDVIDGFEGLKSQLVLHGTVLHRLEGQFGIIVAYSFEVGIGNYRNSVVTDHATGIIPCQVPDRHNTTFLVLGVEGADEVVGSFCVDDGEQGVSRPVGIPKRKDGVILQFVALMDLEVHTPVTAIRILVEVGGQHQVIHGTVEIHQVVLPIRFNHNFTQVVFPARRGLLTHFLEGPLPDLLFHIPLCAFDIHGRYPYIGQNRFVVGVDKGITAHAVSPVRIAMEIGR